MKKTTLALLVLLFSTVYAMAQTDTAQVKPDQFPTFKNGPTGWARFLESNLDRDLLEKNRAPEGKYTSIASFTVDSVGGIRDIRIEQDPGFGVADELTRMLKKSKQWTPAQKNGVPITFRTKQSLTLFTRGYY